MAMRSFWTAIGWVAISSAVVVIALRVSMESARRRRFRKPDAGMLSEQWMAQHRGSRNDTDT
jgi:hypothetical protein